MAKKRVKKRCSKKRGACGLKRLKNHIPMLQVLHKAKPKMTRSIINTADPALLTTLSECSLNVLNGNQKISPKCKQILTKHKNQLRHLAAPPHKVSYKRKKKILLQKGGFIIPALIGSVLSGLLSKLV